MSEAPAGLIVHVIDDDDQVRPGFVRLLRSARLDARGYPSIQHFIDQADKAMPGCILMDVTMPGIDGIKALEILQESRNVLPVIVVSAHEGEPTQRLARELGAKLYLRKPVDDQALVDAISWVTAQS